MKNEEAKQKGGTVQLRLRMELLSDAIFGSGESVPGAEDIAVLHDDSGFPYYRGATMKGIFREQLVRWLVWEGRTQAEAGRKAGELLGEPGEDRIDEGGKIVFADFTLSAPVRSAVLAQIGDDPELVLAAFTHTRTFTAISEDGVVSEGTLRVARCVNRGTIFYSELCCPKDDEALICSVLGSVKWIGTMRGRGFGKVRITAEEV